MKRTLLTAALLLFAGSTSLTAQNGYGWGNRSHSWQRPNYNPHYDRYRDYGRDRDIRQDQREIDHDKWEIRDDLRGGDYRAARREREELREREYDLRRDRHNRCDRRQGYDYNRGSTWGRNPRWDWSRFASVGWR